MEAKVKWRRYLVQRRANSINPLQLEPRQLVFPVPIKDGLRKQRLEHVSGGWLQRQMFSELLEQVVLFSPAAAAWSPEAPRRLRLRDSYRATT